MENIMLKNEYLTVMLNSYGAEMTSIRTADGKEYLHQKDMIFWNRQAPVLFPICGAAGDNKIIVDGKSYNMPKHGFAMNCDFTLTEHTEDIAVFAIASDEETKKIYPYDFELVITYKLLGKSIDISYKISNTGSGSMYYSIGAHEGYICYDGLENYKLIFEKSEEEPYYFEDRNKKVVGYDSENNCGILNLSGKMFENGTTVVFEKPASNSVILKNKIDNSQIRVEFEDFDNLFVWSAPQSDFVCIEPWCGTAEKDSPSEDISKKEYIHEIQEKDKDEKHHIITIN